MTVNSIEGVARGKVSEWDREELGKILTAIVRSYSLVVIDAEGVKSSRDVHVPQHCAPASPANTIRSPSTFTFFTQNKQSLSKNTYVFKEGFKISSFLTGIFKNVMVLSHLQFIVPVVSIIHIVFFVIYFLCSKYKFSSCTILLIGVQIEKIISLLFHYNY